MSTRRPVILLGAARSGTKFVRSVIASSAVVAATPYDMNYIWRFGNETHPHDALPSRLATEGVARFICSQVNKAAGVTPGEEQSVVEKTVSNVLRIPFVYKVLPDARFVFLIRDGRDVVESAMRCWREPPRAGYVRHKLASFPWRHCAPYAFKHLKNVSRRMLGLSPSVSSWGPRYAGIDTDVAQQSLAFVCARQWLACIEAYERDRHVLPTDVVYKLRYEDLVARPRETADHLSRWLGLPDATAVGDFALANVNRNRVGSASALDGPNDQLIEAMLAPTLERWGYANPAGQKAAA